MQEQGSEVKKEVFLWWAAAIQVSEQRVGSSVGVKKKKQKTTGEEAVNEDCWLGFRNILFLCFGFG